MIKRGQVSLFIIIGLVLVISIALFIFVKEKTTIFSPETIAPAEIKPIKQFTETCIIDLANDAAFLLMTQGGYLNPQDVFPDFDYQKDSHIDIGFKVPMWYYRGENRIPSYTLMEQQLSSFVTERMLACLNNYDVFKEEYDIAVLAPLQTSAVISDNDISVTVTYPLEITDKMKNKVTNWEKFNAKVDSSLGKLYRLAFNIMTLENNRAFLESLTDEMIAASDWLPYEGLEFNCKPKTWNIFEMKDYIKTLIFINLQFLTFEGTKYRDTGMLYYDKLYRYSLGTEEFSDIKVNAIYDPEWELKLDVTPSRGNIVRPIETEFSYLTVGCVKLYHHKYDVEYPVMFQLIDTKKPEQQFYFGTPVILKDNLANRANEVVSWPINLNQLDSTEYCSNTTTETRYVVDEFTGQLIAYPDELVEKDFYPLRVIVLDKYYGGSFPIVNASISYQCVGFLCPDIGKTDFPKTEDGLYTGELPQFKGEFPPCEGGHVIAEKQGYITGRKQQTASEETAKSNPQVTLELIKKMPKQFKLKVEQDRDNIKSIRDIKPDEIALIIIKNIEQDIEQYILFDNSEDIAEQEFYLLLGDYNYEVDIKLLDDDNIVGGAFINWNPKAIDVLNKGKVVFYAERKLTVAPPTTQEDYQELWEFALANSKKPVLI